MTKCETKDGALQLRQNDKAMIPYLLSILIWLPIVGGVLLLLAAGQGVGGAAAEGGGDGGGGMQLFAVAAAVCYV